MAFHPNLLRYIKSPTYEQVMTVVEAHKVQGTQFERFYGIAYGAINQMKVKHRTFPTKHWHIIYECLKLIEEGKPLPVYKEDAPKPAESFLSKISLFKSPKKKRTTKKYKIKKTGSLCELC